MPDREKRPAQLTVGRDVFENYFLLDGAGRQVALDAIASGRIETPYEAIEIICLVNRLFASMLLDRFLEELTPLGRADEYATAEALSHSKRSARIAIEALGKERIREIVPDVMRRLREDVGIPELEVSTADSFRLRGGPQENREHPLSWLLADEDVSEPAVLSVDRADFEGFFKIDGPGYWVVRAALDQDIIGTPYEMVEMICAVNESIATKVFERLSAALTDRGQADELRATTDGKSFTDLAIAALGDRTLGACYSGVLFEVAEQFHVSVTETEKRPNEKHALWLATVEKHVS
jgi:hypothetical protein